MLESGRWFRGGGDRVTRFESALAEVFGARHVATASGTTALLTALVACDVQAGDEVLVSSYSFIASSSVIFQLNALPIFIDSDPEGPDFASRSPGAVPACGEAFERAGEVPSPERPSARRTPTSRSNGVRAPGPVRIVPFAAGVTGVTLLVFALYAATWPSFDVFAQVSGSCAELFCDFIIYYYPMGEAVFRTGLPVSGFLYSPFVALLLAAFPPLGLTASLVLWGIVQVLFVVLYLLLFHRLVQAGPRTQALFAALALTSYPLLLNQLGGQVSVFMTVALLGLLVLNERGHRAAGAGLHTTSSFSPSPRPFWANLLLLAASYVQLLPPALRRAQPDGGGWLQTTPCPPVVRHRSSSTGSSPEGEPTPGEAGRSDPVARRARTAAEPAPPGPRSAGRPDGPRLPSP